MAAIALIIEVRVNEWTRREPTPHVPFPYSPHVPYSPEEIASDAAECVKAGASLIHYHTRETNGDKSMAPGPYRKAARLIKETGALVMPTLGMDTLPADKRMDNLIEMNTAGDVMPDLVPIDVISCNMDLYDGGTRTFTDFSKFKDGSDLYQNSPVTWTTLATKIRELGMKPVPILWDIGSIRGTQALVEMGLLAPPLFCEVALTEGGQLCGHPGTMKGLQAHLDFFPGDDWLWTVLVWGASLLPMAEAVIRKGGHISIGLGDYGYPELGSPSNAYLVKQVAQIARSVGRPLATPDQAREMLALK
jgi:3-keto-5-aminohexanoate cleavage enzyme